VDRADGLAAAKTIALDACAHHRAPSGRRRPCQLSKAFTT